MDSRSSAAVKRKTYLIDSTDTLSNESMTSCEKSKSEQLHFVLNIHCTDGFLDRVVSAPNGSIIKMSPILFSMYFQCILVRTARLIVMMVEVLMFPFDANDEVNSQETIISRSLRDARTLGFGVPQD